MPNVEMFELYERTKKFIRPINIYKLPIKYKWQTGLTYQIRGYNVWKIIERAVQVTSDCEPTACPVMLRMGSRLERMALENADSIEAYYDNVQKAMMKVEIAASIKPCDCDMHDELRERFKVRHVEVVRQN